MSLIERFHCTYSTMSCRVKQLNEMAHLYDVCEVTSECLGTLVYVAFFTTCEWVGCVENPDLSHTFTGYIQMPVS